MLDDRLRGADRGGGAGRRYGLPAAAPDFAAGVASASAQPGSGSQSSSVKQTTSPEAARDPRLRAVAGPRPGARISRAPGRRLERASDRGAVAGAVVDDDDLDLRR